MQRSYRGFERRRFKRYATAAAYWITQRGDGRRLSAWMTDRSDGGAALLVSEGHGLHVGDCVALSGIYSADIDVAENTPAVPRIARVVRVDVSSSKIRQVGLRFETEVNAVLGTFGTLNTGVADSAPMSVPARELGGMRPSLPAIDIYPVSKGRMAS